MLNIKNKYLHYIIASTFLLSLSCYSQNVFAEANNNKQTNSAAMKVLQNTLSNNPNSITAKLACARVYMKNEKYAEAEELIMQILEDDPNNAKANKLLKELNKIFSNNIKKEEPEEPTKAIETPIQIEPQKSSDSSEQLNKPAPNVAVTKTEKTKTVKEKQIKLPTKEEILQRAKARRQAEEKNLENTNAPLAIQAPKISNKAAKITNQQTDSQSEDFIEPITITPKISEDENLSDNSSLPEKKTLIYLKNR
ncbi:MAG: tetratricopeptide repeat protein [Candidatus Riflebacteria bacterium]|nr:tetratricopeptide repeat protein [Candidatus Riflebacteria bacterium]